MNDWTFTLSVDGEAVETLCRVAVREGGEVVYGRPSLADAALRAVQVSVERGACVTVANPYGWALTVSASVR